MKSIVCLKLTTWRQLTRIPAHGCADRYRGIPLKVQQRQ